MRYTGRIVLGEKRRSTTRLQIQCDGTSAPEYAPRVRGESAKPSKAARAPDRRDCSIPRGFETYFPLRAVRAAGHAGPRKVMRPAREKRSPEPTLRLAPRK